jgi:ribosome-associated heat shock protein Hsp15
LEKVRIDKYLWAIRIFKTRSLASDACYKSKVLCKDVAVKSSYSVKKGDTYIIKINKDFSRIIEVIDLVEKRGSAEEMKPFYIDHSPPYVSTKKEPSAFYTPMEREKGSGRPTKKNRRDMKDEGLF